MIGLPEAFPRGRMLLHAATYLDCPKPAGWQLSTPVVRQGQMECLGW